METFKTIPIAPDYEISDFATVRRIKPAKRTRAGRVRKSYLSPKGYAYVSLRVDGKARGFQLHRLVMLTFCGPSELQVNHRNGVKHDNRLENLEYVTPAANYGHALDAIKTAPYAERHGNAKLNEADIPKIFAMHAEGMGPSAIGRVFGVTGSNIGYILKGKAWKRMDGPKAAHPSNTTN